MLLGFKTELKLNNQERTALMKHCGVARHAWNWGLALTKQILDHNKDNPDSKIKFPSAIDLHKWLVALVKSENEWYYECSKSTPQQALMQSLPGEASPGELCGFARILETLFSENCWCSQVQEKR